MVMRHIIMANQGRLVTPASCWDTKAEADKAAMMADMAMKELFESHLVSDYRSEGLPPADTGIILRQFLASLGVGSVGHSVVMVPIQSGTNIQIVKGLPAGLDKH